MGKPSNIQTMDSRGVECIWGEIDKHPHCAHGNFSRMILNIFISV